MIAVFELFAAPLIAAVCPAPKLIVAEMLEPLTDPDSVPLEKQGDPANVSVPVSTLPDCVKFADNEPKTKRYSLEFQDPNHVPPSPTGAVTVKIAAADTPPPGAGLLTTTAQAPVPPTSNAVNVICKWLLSTKVTECVRVQKVTVDEGRKPLPLIVTVREELLPSGAEDGVRLIIAGLGFIGATVKAIGNELPPPGAGLLTTTAHAPVPARSVTLNVICKWLPSTKVAVCGTVQNVTVEVATKPVPLIVTVKGPLPDRAEDGERLVIVGTGLEGTGDWTAIVTVLDVIPPIERITGTELPDDTPSGTCTFIW